MNQEAKILVGIGIITTILVVGAAFLMGGNTSNPQTLSQSQEKLLVRQDSEKISSPSAKVTLVEFGDYQCPACKAAYPIVKKIIADEKGKINFVFRNFAFLGDESTWAAEAAECAGEQGKFWEYHDYLYEHQGVENSGTFSKNNLEEFAKTLGLSSTQFNVCLSTDKYQQKILDDKADGQSLGINSTPTFFLNGEKLIGLSGYNDFKGRIDSLVR